MVSLVRSCALSGLLGTIVDVEADVSAGLPVFTIVGLPDTAVSEARDRIRAAFRNADVGFPRTRITVNLAPADIKKEGSSFDLAIAVGLVLAQAKLPFDGDGTVIVGELGLDGGVRPVPGMLSIALAATRAGFLHLIIPQSSIAEIDIIPGLTVFGVSTLAQAVAHVTGTSPITPHMTSGSFTANAPLPPEINFSHIAGLAHAKRALEIAASGGHHVLLSGPPGTGKTLLARALTGILPAMSRDEVVEVSAMYSVAGLMSNGLAFITTRPFRNPHHTASPPALIGGGSHPKPGEVSLAHRGVLFLDELPEYPRNVLECLRQPLEDGQVTVARAAAHATFPARFTLVAAQNPCPCGYAGDPEKRCSCAPGDVLRYQSRVSGPLLDRIDLAVTVPRIAYRELQNAELAESSEVVRERVERARALARARYAGRPYETNAEMTVSDVRAHCSLDHESANVLEQASNRLHLSPRAMTRILKVSRTIADLDGAESIGSSHVLEAVQYRLLERN